MTRQIAADDSAMTQEMREQALRRSVRYCADNSAFYRDRLSDAGAEPDDIRTLADLNRLPVFLDKTAEAALQSGSRETAGHPFGDHLCAPIDEVVSVASTSGTTGDPTYYSFTASDVAITDDLWGRALRFAGVRPGETVVHGFGLSMFLAGYPLVRAIERFGARAVPVGAEVGSEKLLKIVKHMRPSAICLTPSYAEFLGSKEDMSQFGIRHVLCAGEPGAGLPEVRARISEAFGGAEVTDILGGVHGIINVSCPAHRGQHVLADDHSIQQLVDPDSGAPIEWTDGAIGMRVKTTLDWEAQPQLRASVGDMYEVLTSECECGSPTPRVRVLGRVDDLLIVKGVKLYPAAVQNLLHEFRSELNGHFQIVLPAPGPRVEPPLVLEVEARAGDEPVLERFTQAMSSRFSVTPTIHRVEQGTLPRSTHKSALIRVQAP